MLGGAINLGVYGSLIDNFERKMNIDRGDRNSVLVGRYSELGLLLESKRRGVEEERERETMNAE